VTAGQTGLQTTAACPTQQNKLCSGTNSGAVGTVCTGMSNLGKLKETAKRTGILHYVSLSTIHLPLGGGGEVFRQHSSYLKKKKALFFRKHYYKDHNLVFCLFYMLQHTHPRA